jgi:opacity protein-like surface antigen
MKKTLMIFCTMIAVMLSVSAHAYARLPQSVWQNCGLDSWLFGLSAGYADREGDIDVRANYAAPPNFPQTTVIRDLSDTGFIYSAFAGYQVVYDYYLLGIELDVERQKIEDDHRFAFSDPRSTLGWNANVRYRRNTMIGLTGRYGYALADFIMPYVRLGAEVSRDKLITFIGGEPSVYPRSVILQEKAWVYRFLLGVGIEMPIPCMPFNLRLEYDYHSKGKTIETNGMLLDGIINPEFQSDLQPKTQSGRLAIVWNFF